MPKLSCTLLVDDDPATNFLNRKLLERLEMTERILIATNGREALQCLDSEYRESDDPKSPALVLLDLNMPVMNGLEFLAAYHVLPTARQFPVVVVLTTSAHPLDIERLRHGAVAGYITKPLTADKVASILQTHFAA